MSVITAADETASFAAAEGIAATIHLYLEAARTGDSNAMRKPFLDTARIQGSYRGKPVDYTLDGFCDAIAKGGPAAEVKARVAAIDIEGTAASARIESENWRGTRYTDFFVLLQRDGVWKIASKVFFAHSRA
ncbi:MAG TPA: nuclear transport factor 2 family protein [Stellaceae bacterium]|jgi:hypothetical protein